MRTTPNSHILVQARHVGKKYTSGTREFWALRNLNLCVGPSEVVCLWGPSGCGKTTALGILAGLESPTEGEVWLDGIRMDTLSEREAARLRRTSLSFVFQFFYLLPNLSVAENIALPLVMAGRAHGALKEAENLAELLGLSERLRSFPGQLSGGEQQRVAIARALITQPKVLLADEPTGNLDSQASGVVLETLRTLATGGRAILVASHSADIRDLSDRVVNLAGGPCDATMDLEA